MSEIYESRGLNATSSAKALTRNAPRSQQRADGDMQSNKTDALPIEADS
jgi:hypothetical protein